MVSDRPMDQTSWYPSGSFSIGFMLAGWGYFLYIRVIDSNGGLNILWLHR